MQLCCLLVVNGSAVRRDMLRWVLGVVGAKPYLVQIGRASCRERVSPRV